ncbi:ABC transporter related [Caldicellulosiruptor obsidiansis OB47]|uniref:ABC transporter related n=1 Tax=Caldicellulosiruptor obsidiansis (strain ATCC BAA-2073 / JCM 16842 / OB47) TaxID=608506 RepID=D9TJM4_CALOO|nr:energy-coupling factor transporter ATPase [Caldicellulosiruptor obsidiansis]ADL42206.1 ABC transporter related [Caldicellulosiruptor obsidiansis OB47]
MSAFIEFKNVSFSYVSSDGTRTPALIDINLKIERGEFVAILGLNGSGKSTLAKLINGLLIPEKGYVIVDGMNTKDTEKIWDIRRKCGYIFQNPDNQLVASIVEEDVAFGPENLGMPREKIRKAVDSALLAVEMMEYKNHPTYKLSGGQKQRVAIAGVLAMKPDCIILDEPTSMLDPKGRKEVISTIERLNKEEKKTIILVTHNVDEMLLSQRSIVLDKGHIKFDGPSLELLKLDWFYDMGFDMPQILKLSIELKKRGVKTNKEIWSVDEMERFLCSLK